MKKKDMCNKVTELREKVMSLRKKMASVGECVFEIEQSLEDMSAQPQKGKL